MTWTMPTLKKSRPVTIGRQRMWNAMRILKTFTAFELAYAAQADTRDAARYVRLLHRAGYLSQHPARFKSSGKVWKIERRTGPRRPVYRRADDVVWDANERRSYPVAKK